MPASFKKYIEDYYFDIVSKKISSYIVYNYSKIPFRLNTINNVDYAKLEEAYIKNIYVNDYFENYIGINILVETGVTIGEYNHGEYNYDYDYPWFSIKCKCKFDNVITNFIVLSIECFEGVDKESFGLTDNLIPYIKKEKFDDYAEKILNKIYPEAMNGEAVDTYEFAKRLGLNVIEVVFKDESKIGAIYFEEYKTKTKITPANTIKVSKNKGFFGFERCINFTIMHECGHYILHKKAFQLEKLFNSKAKSIECYYDGTCTTKALTTPGDWMEWQANNLASRLLMPKEPFKRKVEQLLIDYKLENETTDYLDYYEQMMIELAKYYGSPLESVKIRLIELGYEFPLGCFIKIDGKSILPHSFAKGSLKVNETFSISEIDSAIYTVKEKCFNNNSFIDAYVYVQGHLCINHPKYLSKNEFGKIILTDYARHHMDECFLKFELDVPKKIGHYEVDYKTYKILNRKKGNHAEIVVNGFSNFNEASLNNNKELLKEALQLIDELYLQLPRTTIGLFKLLKEYSGCTIDELIDMTGLSKNNIEDYLYKKEVKFNKDKVILLLLSMNIPPKVSFEVLKLCNCQLTPGQEEEQWKYYVLQARWIYSLKDNVKFLNLNNVYL